MFCVIFKPAAPAGARPLMVARRAGAAQEEKRSATRTTAGNPNVRNFTITIPAVARGKRLKAARRESCRIIRHLGSGNQIDDGFVFARATFVSVHFWLWRRIQADCIAYSTRLRSEEHTSELQSQSNLVCRLLLE